MQHVGNLVYYVSLKIIVRLTCNIQNLLHFAITLLT